MRGFIKVAPYGLLIAGGLALASGLAAAQAQTQAQARAPAQAQPLTPGAIVPAADPAAIGRNVLNAGPDPRVQLDGLSRDHAAIFGTQDEDEQAVLDQERALRAQQDQMRMLERLLTQKPAAANSPAAATIPLNSGTSMNMAPLAPATSGSQLGGGDAQRSVEQMQRRVDELRRGGDTLRQGVR
ncbi:hypothetical protein A9974_01850 [Achromobacter sp. UMC71]|nr:hypothetical protein [Achromobacter sp. UMC71]